MDWQEMLHTVSSEATKCPLHKLGTVDRGSC